MLRNSPTAIRVLKSALNAVDDGHAGLQVHFSKCCHIRDNKQAQDTFSLFKIIAGPGGRRHSSILLN